VTPLPPSARPGASGEGPPEGGQATFAAAVAERVGAVRARIDALASGRPVLIVAVTKGFGPEAVDAAASAGITAIGENYAQELIAKASRSAGGERVRWHFIGAVQRNKVASLAPFVAVWQTVDRPAAADTIARHSPGATALVEVNLIGDPARSGCSWDDVDVVVDAGRRAGLTVVGLMGIGPPGPPQPALFARLAATGGRLGLAELSMGMTGDYEVAVAEGSTMVRLGTALFGPRPRPADLRR
jgi:pyridoxal phosphate enzyme (YggS family)